MPKLQSGWIVQIKNWEYNDNYYQSYPDEARDITNVFKDKAKAEQALMDLELMSWREHFCKYGEDLTAFCPKPGLYWNVSTAPIEVFKAILIMAGINYEPEREGFNNLITSGYTYGDMEICIPANIHDAVLQEVIKVCNLLRFYVLQPVLVETEK